MNICRIFKLEVKKLLPFLFIFLVTVGVMPSEQSSALPPPPLQLIAPEVRTADDTDFTLPDVQGNSIHLADLRGNVVLLNFFATWCPPCREEMPSLEELFRKYTQQNFVVLGVAGDIGGERVVPPFIKEYKVTFPVVLDTKNRVFRQYLVRGVPKTYVLDRQGRIAAKITGGFDWSSREVHTFIEQLLQEPEML